MDLFEALVAGVLNVQRTQIARLAKHAWQATNVEPAWETTIVKMAKCVWIGNVLDVGMIKVAPLTKPAWQLVSVDAARKMVTVAEAEPVRMASVSVGKWRGLVAVVEMGDQLSISILSRSAVLLLEEYFGRGKISLGQTMYVFKY